jgi:hypothetical protein
MTRYLSLALGAQQPSFGQEILELEKASGRPGEDIRLSSELEQSVRIKITELGLDPNDTTGPELYNALQTKLSQDDQAVCTALGIDKIASTSEVLSAVQKFLQKNASFNCFAIKLSTAKRLFKKKVPKNVMKRLGYRSLDSMLKHESVASIYAAALMVELPTWQKQFREQYTKLHPSDFEQRKVTVIYPKAKRWVNFSEEWVAASRHNIMCLKEFGTIVLLPLPVSLDGLAITTLLLSLYYMNDIRAYSSFAKLQQVKPEFGKIIQGSVVRDQLTAGNLAGKPVTWKAIQHYYGHLKSGNYPEVFEPHVQPEDLKWQDAEDELAKLEPALKFWKDTQYVCMLYNDEPISLNILDVSLGYCNHLSFADRIMNFAREHLWYELIGRYLHQGNLEEALCQQLSTDLIDQPVLTLGE